MRAALYARVSTVDRQEVENQLIQLREFVKQRGWKIYKEYIDKESGGKPDRQQFQELFRDAHQRKFDIVVFWSLDRFSREGAWETINYLKRLESYGVGFVSYTEQYLDTTGIFKEAIIALLATLAKQERLRIRKRVKAGLERAKRKGKRLGRPRKVTSELAEKIRKDRQAGMSITQLQQKYKLGRATIHGVIKNVPKTPSNPK